MQRTGGRAESCPNASLHFCSQNCFVNVQTVQPIDTQHPWLLSAWQRCREAYVDDRVVFTKALQKGSEKRRNPKPVSHSLGQLNGDSHAMKANKEL
jgi:hypothetical protein